MSKIPLQYNKESLIGIGLLGGAFLLFSINVLLAISTLIQVYGSKPLKTPSATIDSTALSEAVKFIDDTESAN